MAVLFLHDAMVNVSVWLQNKMAPGDAHQARLNYDIFIAAVAGVLLVGLLAFLLWHLKKNPENKGLKIGYFVMCCGFIVGHASFMFLQNIEGIHSVQFGLLALLIFPLTGSFWKTLFWVFLAGAIDEYYQYVELYPDKDDYYDFNDMIMDTLGGCMAMTLLAISGVKARISRTKWYISPIFITTVVIAVATMIGFATDLVQFSPIPGKEEQAVLILQMRGDFEGFWRTTPNSTLKYHVMHPIEGLLVAASLMGIFSFLDRKLKARPQ